MSIELLERNIEREKEMIEEIFNRFSSKVSSNLKDQRVKQDITLSLISQIKILNNAIPDLLENISFYKKMPPNLNKLDKQDTIPPKKDKISGLMKVNYTDKSRDLNLIIKKEDEKKFLENLTSYHSSVKKIDKDKNPVEGSLNSMLFLSNRLFKDISIDLVKKGYFNSLKSDLRKIASPMIISSYVSMMFSITIASFCFSLLLSIILLILKVSIPLSLTLLILIPAIVFISFYLYPSSKRKSLEKEIDQELPFMAIYMSAISMSGIEPSRIFQIIISSEDYPFIRREVKKLTNYINFYGYDLVSALKRVAENSPSELLSQLFNGLATTITSGGELSEYLNKHSETLLFDYRLEREKYTRTAETFMNIYISIVIAAPMIMTMLFVLMSLTNMGPGNLGPFMIGLSSVSVITFLNIFFLIFLNAKQPKF